MIGPTRFMAFFQLAPGLRVTPAGQLPKKPRSLRLLAHTGRMDITGCSGHCRVYPHGEPPATGSPSASHRVATREIVSLDHSLKDHGPTEGRKAASQATPPRRMMRASRGLIPLRPADHVLLGALFRVLPSCSAPGLLPQSPCGVSLEPICSVFLSSPTPSVPRSDPLPIPAWRLPEHSLEPSHEGAHRTIS